MVAGLEAVGAARFLGEGVSGLVGAHADYAFVVFDWYVVCADGLEACEMIGEVAELSF
jgi:hypothetical protein